MSPDPQEERITILECRVSDLERAVEELNSKVADLKGPGER